VLGFSSFVWFLSVRNRFDLRVEIKQGCCNGNGDAVGGDKRCCIGSSLLLLRQGLLWQQYIPQAVAPSLMVSLFTSSLLTCTKFTE
jgi:hypothetical protein